MNDLFLESLRRALAALHYTYDCGAADRATPAELAQVNLLAFGVRRLLPVSEQKNYPEDFAALRRATGEELTKLQTQTLAVPARPKVS